MASYIKFENESDVYVEQNIWDNNELESYDAVFDTPNGEKTAKLYYCTDSDGVRYYMLGLLDISQSENIHIVSDDLTDVFQYKTAKTRRKHIYNMIRESLMLREIK